MQSQCLFSIYKYWTIIVYVQICRLLHTHQMWAVHSESFSASTSHKLMVKIYNSSFLILHIHFRNVGKRNSHSSTSWKSQPASTTFQSCRDYQFLPVYMVKSLMIHPLHPFWKIFKNYMFRLSYQPWVNGMFRGSRSEIKMYFGPQLFLFRYLTRVRFTQIWTINSLRSLDCWPIL